MRRARPPVPPGRLRRPPRGDDAALADGYARTLDRLLDLNAFDLSAERVPPPTVTPVPDPLPANGDERRAVQNRAHRQHQTLRQLGPGNFETLTQAVAKDPAMILWLDTQTNAVGKPNENFSRELMELFALGIGNYTEKDVAEGARAFTGWRYDRAADGFAFVAPLHDGGLKTVLGTTGTLEINYSQGLEDWLAREQVSLAFAIPPAELFLGIRGDDVQELVTVQKSPMD